MKEKQIRLINKMFNSETIRTVWNSEEQKYYISVVDIVAILVESKDPRHYWNVLKSRLKKEGNESVTNCDQLKLKSSDGKYYKTDVVDIEGMFRIIESIPSKNAEPIKLWLARLGRERIDEVFDPSITVQRAIDTYRAKGYDEEWIIKRNKGIQDRKKLTDVWKEGGVTSEVEFAILTNDIYKEWSGMTAGEYRDFKGLRKESLRDNMTDIEVAFADLGEIATRELVKARKPVGLEQNKEIAKIGGRTAKVARDELEKNLGKSIISKENELPYKYTDDSFMIETKE